MSAILQVQDGSINQSTGSRLDGIRVALVHHWFVSFAGGERVVDTIAGMFPSADIFTLFLDQKKLSPALRGRKITTSFLDRIPGARKVHRHCLPLYPLAAEMLDLSGYDLVITSDSGPMKGVITDLDATHICYCHSPMRYLWDGYSAYRRDMSSISKFVFELTSHYVRNWDYLAAQRVDHFIANSRYVARRIHKYYRRQSTIIHPPIDTSRSYLANSHDDYYLAVGRLVPYKRTDVLIGACQKLGRKLVIVGDGPEMERLKKSAGKNVEFVGEAADEQLREIYARCRALLFAADEDFGMVPLEAQSYGRPVIAYGKGGSLETVIGADGSAVRQKASRGELITGIFFERQSADSLANALLAFESCEHLFVPEDIQSHARRFDTSVFVERLNNYIGWARDNREDVFESAIATNEFEDARMVRQIA
jgi:glycosyltransferase involved in cell wall biosynthesis